MMYRVERRFLRDSINPNGLTCELQIARSWVAALCALSKAALLRQSYRDRYAASSDVDDSDWCSGLTSCDDGAIGKRAG
jgi:hypothetical protein